MIRKGSDVREHPTQKPLRVMEWCLDHLPDDAGLICDPFMGSGTTGVAALNRGLKFIGIERRQDYFETAITRIRDALDTPALTLDRPEQPVQEPML
jgi:DNA modification methylase